MPMSENLALLCAKKGVTEKWQRREIERKAAPAVGGGCCVGGKRVRGIESDQKGHETQNGEEKGRGEGWRCSRTKEGQL